jgi:hypothetical protein
MPVGSLYTAKDAVATAMPLLLATITFSDGTVLRLSTHDLTGGAVYAGNAYLPYIVNKQIAATQALGEQGIDVPASVNLQLADSDFVLWNNYETLHGFKGSKLELVAVMYDVLANGYSSDSRTIFRGICKEPGGKLPQHDGKNLSIGFASKFNMTDLPLPGLKVQTSCPWAFPETLTERQGGADNSDSMFFRCGYSPDATGGNARGNYQSGTTAFTDCSLTADDCKARGMFEKDSANRVTGRFGGIQWNPPGQSQNVRGYVDGKWSSVFASSNQARYGDYIPMLYGRAWTEPLVINTLPDGNYLTITALVCFGQVDVILDVVVNDYHIPHTYNDSEAPITTGPGISNNTEAALSGWWTTLNKGDRDGMPGSAGSGEDPYGSYCCLRITVPLKVAAAGSIPQVRVYAEKGSSYPADQIQDILTNWAGWDAAELNSSSFTASAALDIAVIPYEYQSGISSTRHRFTSSLYLKQQQTVADVLRGLRNCRRGILGPDETGLLRLSTKQTLADQQPAPITGSNYNTAITSKKADGTTANGYAAYRFDESNIIGFPRPNLITNGNTYTVQFQNSENSHSIDTLQVIDSDDIRRSGQNIPGVFSVLGADNYDQLHRVIASDTAEHFRGNWRNDTGGSVEVDIVASIRAVHLSVGDIVLLNWELLGISDQLFRVTSIAPTTNFETATIGLTWHVDDWYVDTYGQLGQPVFTNRFRDKLLRPSLPWLPYGEQPATGDSIFDPTDWSFGIAQSYQMGADGVIAQLTISGRKIVNITSDTLAPPIVPVQGDTANTGGTLEGGRSFYVKLVAVNAAGELSSTSNLVSIGVPSGTNTNTITVPNLLWDSATDTYLVFAGRTPNTLSYQSGGTGTPSSVTLTDLSVALWGPPDSEFDKYRIRMKVMSHPGTWAWPVDQVTSTTIKISSVPAPGFTVNQYAGCDLTWFGRVNSDTSLPIVNFRIASNTTDTLTLASGAPDPAALGMVPGDSVAMRANMVTFGTDAFGDYIEDPNWISCFSPAGLPLDVEIGNMILFFAGAGRGQSVVITKNTQTRLYADFGFTPDSTSRYVVVGPTFEEVADSDSINNADPNSDFSLSFPVQNYLGKSMVVQVLTVDGGNNESVEAQSPVRDMYLYGKGLNVIYINTDTTLGAFDQQINVDTTNGSVTLTAPPSTFMKGRRIVAKKISDDTNLMIVAAPVVNGVQQTIDGNISISRANKDDVIEIAGNTD